MKSSERKKLILIGASTGGPAHIEKIVAALPLQLNAAIIIAQHMGYEFIPSFVKRLNERSPHSIRCAVDNENVEIGEIFIISKTTQLYLVSNELKFSIVPEPKTHYNPNIDSLFLSASRYLQQYNILSVLLTGIGDDGANGCVEIETAGGQCVVESEKSAIVYGMPARAKERGKNILEKDLDEIIKIISQFGA